MLKIVLFALACLLCARPALAETVPREMPVGVLGVYFGESIKSARRKCETFEALPPKYEAPKFHALCTVKGKSAHLVFTRGKLYYFWLDISRSDYDACAKEILSRAGLSARHEIGDGVEVWGLTFVTKDGVVSGGVSCISDGESGPSMSFLVPELP